MPAHRKYYHIIHRIHDQWCRDNGYKPQAPSYKRQATSYKINDFLDSENSQRFVESAKPQAPSAKLQAYASKGRLSNKR